MTLHLDRLRTAATGVASYSFYVTAAKDVRIRQASLFGDAVTVAGPKGPAKIMAMREQGFDKPVLFDGTGYAGADLDAVKWVHAQRAAGSDRELLPGRYVKWDRADSSELMLAVAEEARLARDLGAVMLVAIDARWMAKRHQELLEALLSAEVPVALVLADSQDPLAVGGAVAGLRALAQAVPDLSLLRADHGAVGLLAAGGTHASIGLTTSTRHLVAKGMSARRRVDNTARLFLLRLLDWFRAAEVAGWNAAGLDLNCHLDCCQGQPLARYLDEDLDATWHNINALAELAEYVLNAEPQDRLMEYLGLCRSAVGRYGLAGIHGPEKPKPQLNSWVFS